MNKQLTKRTIAIAASAALMASVALSGSALAAPPGKGKPEKNPDIETGDRTSISIYQTCDIDKGNLKVHVSIMDNNAGTDKAKASLKSVTVQGLEKTGPQDFGTLGDAWEWNSESWENDVCDSGKAIEIGTTCTITLPNFCTKKSADAKAFDALTTVDTGPNGNRVEYYAQCKDSDLKVEDYCL